ATPAAASCATASSRAPPSQPVVLRTTAAVRRHPRDHLIGVHDVARLAMDAVRRIDLKPLVATLFDHFVDVRRAEPLAGVPEFFAASRVADIRMHEQVRWLVFL